MKKDFRSVLTISGSSLLFSFTPIANAITNPCPPTNIHCDYLTASSQTSGKFIRVKNIQKGHASTSMIFCAQPNQPIMSIPQTAKNHYLNGTQIQWEISQCVDEDCSSSQLLVNDKFTISQNKGTTISTPSQAGISLNAAYGVNCKPEDASAIEALKQFVAYSPLQIRIRDMDAVLNHLPPALDETLKSLHQMRNLAVDAANGTHGSADLANLDTQFQSWINHIDKIQHAKSLDGYKLVTGGTIHLWFGPYPNYQPDMNIDVVIPATDIHTLYLDVLHIYTQADAQNALFYLNNAIDVVNSAR